MRRHSRRSVVRLSVAAGPGSMSAASAQAVSNKPIRLVTPFVAGGRTDVIGRITAERLNQRLATPVVVENRSGGSGNTGAEAVVRAEASGHTLLFATAGVFPRMAVIRVVLRRLAAKSSARIETSGMSQRSAGASYWEQDYLAPWYTSRP